MMPQSMYEHPSLGTVEVVDIGQPDHPGDAGSWIRAAWAAHPRIPGTRADWTLQEVRVSWPYILCTLENLGGDKFYLSIDREV